MEKNSFGINTGRYSVKKSKYFVFCLMYAAAMLCSSFITAKAEIVDRIMAVVNDDIISLYDLNQMIKPYEQKIRTLGYSAEKELQMLSKVRKDMLDQLIDQKLTDQETKRYGITVGEEEINNAINRIKESSYYTDEEFKEALANDGLTIEDLRNRIEEQILRSRLLNIEVKSKIVITKEDMKSYYEEHINDYKGEKKYHLRNIILNVSSYANKEEKLAVKKKMENILSKLKAGESFEKAAGKYSESLADQGGDLGLFKLDELSPQIQRSVIGLKPGQFTSILDTDPGYQVLFVQEIVNTKGKSLEEASPEIKEKLYNEIVDKEFQSWLEKLRKRSHIDVIR
ncbi:MAG: hypothetical protein GY749_15175 [Desulfobacteraceae bacterium]|nr:hypothetical protein [Desulfobacteraceae bacterium]